jgi:Cu+-exporting ATPase
LTAGQWADSATVWEAEGRTLSWLIEQSPEPQVLGLFAFGDSLKPGALQAVQQLRARNISSHLLTGDNRGSANVVAQALGITDVHAEVLPADKAATVATLKKTGVVAMVGDGINDAPALAAAHVSLSPISAADLAQAQADAVFLGDRLAPVLDAITIAGRARALMRQNLILAVVYNAIAVPIAIAGLATPLIAAIAMSGSSLLVTLNALRAARRRAAAAPRAAAPALQPSRRPA